MTSAKFDKWIEGLSVDLARDLFMYGGGLMDCFPGLDDIFTGHTHIIEREEKGMSIYRVFFVNKEDKSLEWEFVVADSDEAAVVKAFVEADLENIDNYHIRVDRCHGL